MSDRLGRINVLRTMIGVCIAAMPALYAAGSHVALLYAAVFVVYWWMPNSESRRKGTALYLLQALGPEARERGDHARDHQPVGEGQDSGSGL